MRLFALLILFFAQFNEFAVFHFIDNDTYRLLYVVKTTFVAVVEFEPLYYVTMNRQLVNCLPWKESTYSSISSAEYCKKWREKMRQNQTFLENERSRKKRERQNMSPEMKATIKVKARLRQREYRRRKKCMNSKSKDIAGVKLNGRFPGKAARDGERKAETSNTVQKRQKEISDSWINVSNEVPGLQSYDYLSEEHWSYIQSILHRDMMKSPLGPLKNPTDNLDNWSLTDITDVNMETTLSSLHMEYDAGERTHFPPLTDKDGQNEVPAVRISNSENTLSFIGGSNGIDTRRLLKVQSPSITSTANDDSADDEKKSRDDKSDVLCFGHDSRFNKPELDQSLKSSRILLDEDLEQIDSISSSQLIEDIVDEDIDILSLEPSVDMNNFPNIMHDFHFHSVRFPQMFSSDKPQVEEHTADDKVQEWLADEHVGNKGNSRNSHGECFNPDEMNTFDLRSHSLDLGIRQKYTIGDFPVRSRKHTAAASRQHTNCSSTASKQCKRHIAQEMEKEIENIRIEFEDFRQRSVYLKQKIDILSKRSWEFKNENFTKIETYKSYFHDLMILNERHSLNSNDSFFSNTNDVVWGMKDSRFKTNSDLSDYYNIKTNILNGRSGANSMSLDLLSCCC